MALDLSRATMGHHDFTFGDGRNDPAGRGRCSSTSSRHPQHRHVAHRGAASPRWAQRCAGQPVWPGRPTWTPINAITRHTSLAVDRGRRRASAPATGAAVPAPCRLSVPPASSRAKPLGLTATAARCSPTTPRWPQPPREIQVREPGRALRTHARRRRGRAMDTIRARGRAGQSCRASRGSCSRRRELGARCHAAAGRRWRAPSRLRSLLTVRPDRDCVWGRVHPCSLPGAGQRCRSCAGPPASSRPMRTAEAAAPLGGHAARLQSRLLHHPGNLDRRRPR